MNLTIAAHAAYATRLTQKAADAAKDQALQMLNARLLHIKVQIECLQKWGAEADQVMKTEIPGFYRVTLSSLRFNYDFDQRDWSLLRACAVCIDAEVTDHVVDLSGLGALLNEPALCGNCDPNSDCPV